MAGEGQWNSLHLSDHPRTRRHKRVSGAEDDQLVFPLAALCNDGQSMLLALTSNQSALPSLPESIHLL